MTVKDRRRLVMIPNDPDIPMTAKDSQRHSATGNDYMKTRLITLSPIKDHVQCHTVEGGTLSLRSIS